MNFAPPLSLTLSSYLLACYYLLRLFQAFCRIEFCILAYAKEVNPVKRMPVFPHVPCSSRLYWTDLLHLHLIRGAPTAGLHVISLTPWL